MTLDDWLNILNSSFVAGVIGGIIVAVANYLLTKGKTRAEIAKLEAEAAKIRAEASQIINEMQNLSATVDYKLAETGEQIIYDSNRFCDPYDFEGKEGQVWDSEKNRHAGPKGRGNLKIENGKVLNIQRTNTEGRFEIWLRKYMYYQLPNERPCLCSITH